MERIPEKKKPTAKTKGERHAFEQTGPSYGRETYREGRSIKGKTLVPATNYIWANRNHAASKIFTCKQRANKRDPREVEPLGGCTGGNVVSFTGCPGEKQRRRNSTQLRKQMGPQGRFGKIGKPTGYRQKGVRHRTEKAEKKNVTRRPGLPGTIGRKPQKKQTRKWRAPLQTSDDIALRQTFRFRKTFPGNLKEGSVKSPLHMDQ